MAPRTPRSRRSGPGRRHDPGNWPRKGTCYGPGEWRTWGLFQAADATELQSVLSSMPLRVWRHDTVTPLTAHPSDPGSGHVVSNQTSTHEADVLDAVLARWKAAVDAHQPEHVAALFTADAIFQGLHPSTVGTGGV